VGLILIGYWAAFALYPLPGPGFDYGEVGESAIWPQLMTGFAAHWNKNSNPAWAFDTWFLNLFHGALVLFVIWLLLLWMYRRKLFLRI
jgi:hypothetical protein